MDSTIIEVNIVDAASWKIKILTACIKFLNWLTIPRIKSEKGDWVINVKFELKQL